MQCSGSAWVSRSPLQVTERTQTRVTSPLVVIWLVDTVVKFLRTSLQIRQAGQIHKSLLIIRANGDIVYYLSTQNSQINSIHNHSVLKPGCEWRLSADWRIIRSEREGRSCRCSPAIHQSLCGPVMRCCLSSVHLSP